MALKNFTGIIILQEERDYRCIIVCLFFKKKAAFASLPICKNKISITLQRPMCSMQFQVILDQKIYEKGKQRGS